MNLNLQPTNATCTYRYRRGIYRGSYCPEQRLFEKYCAIHTENRAVEAADDFDDNIDSEAESV